MSQNPYASPETAPPLGGWEEPEPPQRTSLLAVASIICSIPCCVLPGMGLIGIGLGAASLGLISKSQGRLAGKPAAVTGIFLGLLVTVVHFAFVVGAVQGWNFYSKQMVPAADTAIASAAAGDYDAARQAMTTSAGEATSDRRFRLFVDEIESRRDAIRGARARIGELFNAFGRVYGSYQGQQSASTQQMQDVVPVPFVIECDQGTTLAWVFFDADALEQQRVEVVDMLALFPGAEAATLRKDGPARKFAKEVAGAVIDLEDDDSGDDSSAQTTGESSEAQGDGEER